MSKKISLRVVTVSVILAGAAYLAMGLFTDLDSVLQAIESIPVRLYAVLIALSLASYLARFTRWLTFLRPLHPQISIRDHAAIYFAGFALTTTPGKAGETIRSLYLHPLGVAYPQSLAAFFSERLLDVLAVSALAMFTMGVFTSMQVWFISAALLFLAVFFLVRSRLLKLVLERYGKKRLGLLAGEFQHGVSRFLGNRSLSTALPLSLVAWLCQGVSLAFIVDSFGLDVSPLVVIGIYCLSILAGAASFIPGGIGATEVAISLLLTGTGMDPAQAVAAAIISRVVTLWFAIAIGLVALLVLSGRRFARPLFFRKG